MGILRWLAENWFIFLSAVGIIGGLFYNAESHRSETKTRRISNQIALTEGHREIWKEFLKYPELGRVLEPGVDPTSVTMREEIFVNMVIQHTNAVFHAMRDKLTISPEGLRRDVVEFFSLPIPRAVWDRMKVFQNDRFVAFLESCLNWK